MAVANMQEYTNNVARVRGGGSLYQGPVQPGANEQYFRYTGQTVPQAKQPMASPAQGSGGGSSAPATSSQPSGPDPFQQALDSAYGAEMGYLDQAQGAIQGAQSGIISGINQNVDTSLTNLGASNKAGMGQIDQAQGQGEQRKQDALVAAKRLYNELVMGGQQRFGGASSAGEAYGALTGRELQRNTQQTNTDFSQFMGQIQTAKTNLQTQYENGVRTLEQQRNDALRQAERDYQDKLLSIQHDRSMAAQNKAQAQLSALQNLRNNVYAINVQQAQQSGTLNQLLKQTQAQLQQQEQSIMQSMQGVNQGAQAFNTNTTTNPRTGLAINAPQGGQSFNPTGAISPTRREDLFA